MQSSYNNQILRRMSDEDFRSIVHKMDPVELKVRATLFRANYDVSHVFFVESGQISMLAKIPESEPIEVGMVGSEGATDMLHSGRAPLSAVIQVAGTAMRIDRLVLLELCKTSAHFANLMSRLQSAMLAQVSFTALSHGILTVEQRLARWRIDGDEIQMSHDFFAWMLAVRRAGVTDALKSLRSLGGIETGRGSTIVLDRARLLEVAGGAYGPAELEYERLLGPMLPRPLATA